MQPSQRSYRRDGHSASHGTGDNGRTYSNSSDGSIEQLSLPIPMLRPPYGAQEDLNTPGAFSPARAGDNPPQTPSRQQSFFELHGNQINETYTSRSSPLSSPSKPVMHLSPSPSPRSHILQRRHSPGNYSTTHRPIVRPAAQHWAYHQEAKIKIHGLPTSKWTKDIYQAMSSYGNVVRIEMQPGQRENNAWVIFR